MFTGIIESIGTVVRVESEQSNVHFTLTSPISEALKIDQSVSHNGACLTVIALSEGTHTVTAVEETLRRTNLGHWQPGTLTVVWMAISYRGMWTRWRYVPILKPQAALGAVPSATNRGRNIYWWTKALFASMASALRLLNLTMTTFPWQLFRIPGSTPISMPFRLVIRSISNSILSVSTSPNTSPSMEAVDEQALIKQTQLIAPWQ
jgi:Lumazine binding domain